MGLFDNTDEDTSSPTDFIELSIKDFAYLGLSDLEEDGKFDLSKLDLSKFDLSIFRDIDFEEEDEKLDLSYIKDKICQVDDVSLQFAEKMKMIQTLLSSPKFINQSHIDHSYIDVYLEGISHTLWKELKLLYSLKRDISQQRILKAFDLTAFSKLFLQDNTPDYFKNGWLFDGTTAATTSNLNLLSDELNKKEDFMRNIAVQNCHNFLRGVTKEFNKWNKTKPIVHKALIKIKRAQEIQKKRLEVKNVEKLHEKLREELEELETN